MKRFSTIFILLVAGMCLCGAGTVTDFRLKVVREYPHSTDAYTQGLFFHDGKLYESNGQFGLSSFRILDPESGKTLRRLDFGKKYFVEGSVILGGKLFILTWTNNVVFIYDAATLKYLQTWSYPREGWGLTTDGTHLVASDGSSRIYFLTEDLRLVKTLNVTVEGRPLRFLNELEWVDGKIWANVYTTDMIVIIDPGTGEVTGRVDCSGLLPKSLRTEETDVLNGIAVNDGRVFLTGKNWPRMYEVKLEKK